MANKKITFAEVSQAQSLISSSKQYLKGLTGDKRQQMLANIAAAQKTVTAYNDQEKGTSDKGKAKDLAKQLQDKIDARDIAKAQGKDTTKLDTELKKRFDDIKGLGGTPPELPSDISTIAAPQGDANKPLPIPTGATTQKTKTGVNVVDANGTIIGTTADNKTYTPGFGPNALKTTPPLSSGDKGTGSGSKDKFTLDTPKTAFVGYLKQTFASLEDKTQKAEIDNLLTTAKSQNWTAAEFQSHLEGTSWWQTTIPTMRQFFLDSHDPRKASEFAQTLTNKVDSVKSKLESLGVQIQSTDPVTGKYIDNTPMVQGLAMDAIKNGWTDAQLSEKLATRSGIIFTGGGLVGSSLDQIKRQANLFGVALDKTQMDDIQRGLLNPNDGRDVNYYLTDIKNQAYNNPMYKPFADIMQKNNTDLYSVTKSYRDQMANLLEVSSDAITWKDLMGKAVDSTTGAARTYADFTKQVKQDPLWQRTRNAKETYTSMGEDLMKMFGFIG